MPGFHDLAAHLGSALRAGPIGPGVSAQVYPLADPDTPIDVRVIPAPLVEDLDDRDGTAIRSDAVALTVGHEDGHTDWKAGDEVVIAAGEWAGTWRLQRELERSPAGRVFESDRVRNG